MPEHGHKADIPRLNLNARFAKVGNPAPYSLAAVQRPRCSAVNVAMLPQMGKDCGFLAGCLCGRVGHWFTDFR